MAVLRITVGANRTNPMTKFQSMANDKTNKRIHPKSAEPTPTFRQL